MNTSQVSVKAVTPPPHRPDDSTSRRHRGFVAYFKGRNGRLLLVAALGIVGFSATWLWFGQDAATPLLFFLPCAVMMAICMKGHGGSGKQNSNSVGTSAGAPPGASSDRRD